MGVYEVNEQFNIELANFDALTELHTFNLGKPSPILQACGFDGAFEIRLTKGKVRQKTNKHCYSEAILRDLPLRLQDPLIVAGYLKTSGTLNVVIETFHFNVKESEWQPLLVGVELKQDIQVRGKEQWHVVRSIFPKNLESLGWWIEASTCADSKRIKAAYQPIIYLNKKGISNLLPSHGTIRHVVEKTQNPTTKVVKDFDNPIGEAEVMEFRASLRNAQAEWLSHGRKTFQEEQKKNGKTMNGMDTAKGHGLNPLNCKYSEFVDSCVDRLNRMLRNGETTKEAVNTAKRYLYSLKPIAAANGGKLTRDAIEEADCVDSYNALLKQLAQIGGLSKPSKARTTHRKARDVRAKARDSKAAVEGEKSTNSDEEGVNLFNCNLLEVRSFFRDAVHGPYKFNTPPKAVEMAMVFLDKLCVLAITYGGAISMETLSKCDEYLVSESKVVLPILSKLKDQALKVIPGARQEWNTLVTEAREHPLEPKLNRDAYDINFNYDTNYYYDLTNALLSKRIISEDDGSSVKERLRSFQINEVSVKTVGFFGNSRITSVPVHDYQWKTYADLLLYLMEYKRLAKENGLLLESGELTASDQKESQPKPGAETAPAPGPSAGGTPSIAVRLLRRFLAIHGKTINRRKVSTLLRSLQRAIVGKEIRKTDRNAELIEQMQIALVQMLDSAWDSATVEFDAKALAALQKSVNSEKQSQTVTLLRAYVRLNDTDDRAKAERLLRRMRKAAAVDGELSQEISAARQNLERFLSSGAQKRLEINPYELQGLCGLLGVDGGTLLSGVDNTVYSGKDVQRMDFQTVKLEPRFSEFIGSPEFPFRMMVHGGPGSGKTTFALQLANSLAAHNGKRVLFVSSEEGIGQKLKSKIDRLGLHAPTLYFASTLPDSFSDYDAVFIDSVISMGLTAESLREMYRNAPNTTFVAINQETKDGKARGSLEITHDADIACRCENLSATLEKNRYGDTSKNFAIIA